jgi:hypothetical protein
LAHVVFPCRHISYSTDDFLCPGGSELNAKEVTAGFLIAFGVIWIASPMLRWLVMGESGAWVFALFGAAFLVVGIVAMWKWKE